MPDKVTSPQTPSPSRSAASRRFARRLGLLLPLAFALFFLPPTSAEAQFEIEADPIAYALSGFSFHVAHIFNTTRVSVGTFGADVPEFFHGNEGWSMIVRGATVKWDYLGASLDGFFVGLDGVYQHTRYALESDPTGELVTQNSVGLGVRGGYRFSLGQSGLYLVPWMSVGRSFGGEDVVIDGQIFEGSSLTVFPTIHIGWRF